MNWEIESPHCFFKNKFSSMFPSIFRSFLFLFGCWNIQNYGPCGREYWIWMQCHLETPKLTKLQLKLIYYRECQLNWMVISSRCSMDSRDYGKFSLPRRSKCESPRCSFKCDHFNWVFLFEIMSMTTGNRAYNNMKITCKIIIIKQNSKCKTALVNHHSQ